MFFLTKSCNTNFNFLVFFYGRVQQALIIIPRKEEARNELYFEEALYSSACLNMQALWKVAKRSRPTPLVCSTNSANVCNCTLHHGRAPHASKGSITVWSVYVWCACHAAVTIEKSTQYAYIRLNHDQLPQNFSGFRHLMAYAEFIKWKIVCIYQTLLVYTKELIPEVH